MRQTKQHAMTLVDNLGVDIISSKGLLSEKNLVQHGSHSCYDHSVQVTCLSVELALALKLNVDMKSLVRGALLHDYFLYDWHEKDGGHRFHGFIHAKRAVNNACRDFDLNDIERDIIVKHMFPLNIVPPKYLESGIVCIADKVCALRETLKI